MERAGSGGEPATTVGGSGVIRLDAELGIVSLGEAAGRLIGISPEALLGRRIDEIVDLANLGRLMHSGISFSNQVIVAGTRRLACDYVPIVEDDRIVGGVLTLLGALPEETSAPPDDLTELLRSAGAFMDLDYHGIIILDRSGTVVMVNQSFAEVLDTTPQTMIGKHVHQAYHNSQPSRMPHVMESGKPEISTHYMNGKEVYASRFPLVRGGKVIGCVGKILFKDVREITLLANRLQSGPEGKTPARAVAGKGSLFTYDINSIVGQSTRIAELKETILRVAPKNSNILLRGESGTGKELFAHALHAASTRRYAPFVKVNCAAIPEHLLESELFGYAEGAFTGARKGGQVGKFELAHTGTIFLDEIGDMPLAMQAKLLRILQERELVPLGSTTPKVIDVRVVAATNSNLEQLVREGRFREDLYYRLNVVALTIPSLRERMEDVFAIAKSFVAQFNVDFGLQIQGLDGAAWEIIRHYHWPGNIRELRNVIESAFNVTSGPLIRREDLPLQLTRLSPPSQSPPECPSGQDLDGYLRSCLGRKNIGEIMDDLERLLIEKALELCGGNKLQAAQLLGISRPGLYKKLQKQAPADGIPS
ncbi:Fis family transcriptional regulator [Geobacter pickeringii]|uniref:Fis family transcriptional regulator n=2 Tax=Geobacter pickeringii TaxID=345632 RepID=A0A0B5BIH5_9BACT|nr:Fis family transcriptional regulator [Geobacter pickeringii]